MTPFEQAMLVYQSEPCARTFEQDLRLHFQFGFVFSTPDFFVMGRPVMKDWIESVIVDPMKLLQPMQCDCWHVHTFAGNLSKAWGILPYPLPFISFERKNELRFYRLDALRRLGTLPA